MSSERRFPETEVRSLEGERLVIPRELEGRRNLLAVAFHRQQQRDVDSWAEDFSRLESINQDLVAYEVPVISRRWGPLRGFIDCGMTAAIPDASTRAHTLTAYTSVSRVLEGLGLEGTSEIAVVVSDREGRISWMHSGPRTDAAAESLEAALTG